MRTPTIKAIFTDVHMGIGHAGLNLMIQNRKKVDDLFAKRAKHGDMYLFLNAKRSSCKIYRENGKVVGYLRLHEGAIAGEDEVNLIASEFGGQINFTESVNRAMRQLALVEGKETRTVKYA